MKPYLIAGFIAAVLSASATAKPQLEVNHSGSVLKAKHDQYCQATTRQFMRQYDDLIAAVRATKDPNLPMVRPAFATLNGINQQLFSEGCVSLKTWVAVNKSLNELEQELTKYQLKENLKRSFSDVKR